MQEGARERAGDASFAACLRGAAVALCAVVGLKRSQNGGMSGILNGREASLGVVNVKVKANKREENRCLMGISLGKAGQEIGKVGLIL